MQERRDNAWKGLERVTLNQCRGLYASMSIAAGVNAHALSKYMGHASITITLDRYGHLLGSNESEAASLLDAYLQRELAI
jgi:integrase